MICVKFREENFSLILITVPKLPVVQFVIIFTGRNEVVAKVMFLLVSVILFTAGGGVSEADPPEADSGIRSTSGRYASYWNALLCDYWYTTVAFCRVLDHIF